MKETYFTLENIDTQCKKLLLELDSFTYKRGLPGLNNSTALIITDMQRYFLDEYSHAFISSALPIIPRVVKLAKTFIKAGLPVFVTRHSNDESDAGQMGFWWQDLISRFSNLFDIISELQMKEAIVVNKHQYDAFFETGLEEKLKALNIKNLVICGVMTHLCCETTVRSAFVKGFKVIFPVDTTATYNYAFHQSSFVNLSHGFVIPLMSGQVINKIEEDSRES